ncbi:MAG: hypothetical protein CENE_03753 [Candidatus Celerinatantimonas neptuna]|nr:MAG: hypothetical protein CENE_03753 [Candidatus Celerinatantimonas neptuna]
MSIKLMTDVWDAPAFKGNTKLIMLRLADFANDEGLCWPSVSTIARKCTVSVSTVKTQIRQLIVAEFITVKNRLKTTSEGKITNDTNYYQINMTRLHQVVLAAGEMQPGQKVIRGQKTLQPGAKSGYKPSIDPSFEKNNPIALVV